MDSPVKQPKWKEVEYSRSKIIKSGKLIRKDDITPEERAEATRVIDNWRAAHGFPMHVIYIHLRGMKGSRSDILVAERLKRLDSIIKKLKREPTMSLWTMQDLGGCRFVVPTIEEVYLFAEKYEKSKKRHIRVDDVDYIKSPKPSGYRSLHVVYQYHSDKNDKYNKNMLIEIQFRTHLQHLWATAVETMGIFSKESIKAGNGSASVTRFFVLVSALFAIREGQPLPPDVINDMDEIVHEIESLNAENNFLDFLSGIRVAVDYQKQKSTSSKPGYFILILNYNTKMLRIKSFNVSQFEEANTTYNSIESTRAEDNIDAVLVRASSFNELRSAYPNYFSDINEFVQIVQSYLK